MSTGNDKTKSASWSTNYWLIYKPLSAIPIAKVDIDWREWSQAKKRGWYTTRFQDQKTRTTTYIAIQTFDTCHKFASKCYEGIKAGSWKTLTINLQDYET